MGRSVSYLNNAEYVIYFTNEYVSNCNDSWAWEDFIDNLKFEIKNKLKSYYNCEKWDNRETSIFLENNLCEIGISEYCELYSLSIRVKFDDYADYKEQAQIENFGKHHAEQIRNTLEKCLVESGAELLNRIGTFSNGTGVFETKGKILENAEQVL